MLLDPLDEWYLRKHIRAKSFLDTQMVTDLKRDRKGIEHSVLKLPTELSLSYQES